MYVKILVFNQDNKETIYNQTKENQTWEKHLRRNYRTKRQSVIPQKICPSAASKKIMFIVCPFNFYKAINPNL